MDTKDISGKLLRDGKCITFITDAFQDDFRVAEISFNQRSNLYVIWFNGACIHGCRTVKSLVARLDKLIEKWDLHFQHIY